jgi:hypothetical protein
MFSIERFTNPGRTLTCAGRRGRLPKEGSGVRSNAT